MYVDETPELKNRKGPADAYAEKKKSVRNQVVNFRLKYHSSYREVHDGYGNRTREGKTSNPYRTHT